MTYQAEVLADNPEIYWRYGDAGPTTVVDIGSLGYDGTATGMTFGETGLLVGNADTAVSGDTATDNVTSAPNTPGGSPHTTMSVEVIFQCVGGFGAITNVILAGLGQQFGIEKGTGGVGNANKIRGTWFVSGTGTLTTPLYTISADTTYHVALEADGTNVKLYVNGAEVSSTAQVGNISHGTFFSSQPPNMSGNKIIFDEAALYYSPVGAARWLAHYNAAAGLGAVEFENTVGITATLGVDVYIVEDVVGITAELEAFGFRTVLYTVTKPDYCIDPSYAPDGETIVFAELLGSDYNISTIDADGTNHTVLITGTNPLYEPTFSADGEFVLYAEQTVAPGGGHTYGDWAIKYYNTITDETTTILDDDNANMHPVWMTATQVAFQRLRYGTDSTFRVVLYDITGTQIADNGEGEYPRLVEV